MAAGNYGVYGVATLGNGVYGSAGNHGVHGKATVNYGVFGEAGNYGVYAAAGNYGVYGSASVSYGVYGNAPGNGVYGWAGTHNGVSGYAGSAYGVYGNSGGSYGVYGKAGGSYGVYGDAVGQYGVYGEAESYGVYGLATNRYGVYGNALNGYGVFGRSSTDNGVYGYAAGRYGGYFDAGSGNALYSDGNMILVDGFNVRWSNGAYKAFTIDHPLDPCNQVLRHFSAEGPQALVVYSGTATLNDQGEVDVALPDYFDALSRNPRVQLTARSGSMPGLFAPTFAGTAFVIKGGLAGGTVDWQVTAERDDPKARLERVVRPVEDVKGRPGLPDKGQYISPEVYR